MGPLRLMLLLGIGHVGGALLVTLEPYSSKEVHVTGMISTKFTLKTCGIASMLIRLGSDSLPNCDIIINYNYEENNFTLLQYEDQAANRTMEDFKEVTFHICSSPGHFWLSWGNAALKFGEGSVVDSLVIVQFDFTAQVDSFTVSSYDQKATWNFPELAETTSATLTRATTETSARPTDTTNDGGQGSGSGDSSATEDLSRETTPDPVGTSGKDPETEAGSKSFAPENFWPVRMLAFVIAWCCAAITFS